MLYIIFSIILLYLIYYFFLCFKLSFKQCFIKSNDTFDLSTLPLLESCTEDASDHDEKAGEMENVPSGCDRCFTMR